MITPGGSEREARRPAGASLAVSFLVSIGFMALLVAACLLLVTPQTALALGATQPDPTTDTTPEGDDTLNPLAFVEFEKYLYPPPGGIRLLFVSDGDEDHLLLPEGTAWQLHFCETVDGQWQEWQVIDSEDNRLFLITWGMAEGDDLINGINITNVDYINCSYEFAFEVLAGPYQGIGPVIRVEGGDDPDINKGIIGTRDGDDQDGDGEGDQGGDGEGDQGGDGGTPPRNNNLQSGTRNQTNEQSLTTGNSNSIYQIPDSTIPADTGTPSPLATPGTLSDQQSGTQRSAQETPAGDAGDVGDAGDASQGVTPPAEVAPVAAIEPPAGNAATAWLAIACFIVAGGAAIALLAPRLLARRNSAARSKPTD